MHRRSPRCAGFRAVPYLLFGFCFRFSVYNLTAEFFVGNSEELTEFVPLKKFDLIWCEPCSMRHSTSWCNMHIQRVGVRLRAGRKSS
jgi:hypothetical protein